MQQQPLISDHASRRLMGQRVTALLLVAVVTVGGLGVWLTTGHANNADLPIHEGTAHPRQTGIGVCLQMERTPTADAESIAALLIGEATSRDHLFPSAEKRMAMPDPTDSSTTIAVWPARAPAAVEASRLEMRASWPCVSEVDGWAFIVTRDLLSDGAELLMERADFGSEWSGSIDVSFHPEDTRVRSTLSFSGPFGISGSCWIDETLAIDSDLGLPTVVSESGDDAGLAGLVACRRFADELSEGGAGAQAVGLFPDSLADAASSAAMRATSIELSDDLVVIRGDLR